jgi:hypothetical protein
MISGDHVQHPIDDDDARNGRIVAIFLSGHAENGVALADDYRPHAEYQGDHWSTKSEVHFINVRSVASDRMAFMPAEFASNPEGFLVQLGAILGIDGDGNFKRRKGTPISGTTVLSLTSPNPVPVPIRDLSLFVLFNTVVPKS